MKTTILFILAIAFAFVSQAQIVNIPDANFKNALINHNPVIDLNTDGEIQVSEAEAFNSGINVIGQGIVDMTGIEAFINIQTLTCMDNSIEIGEEHFIEILVRVKPEISEIIANGCFDTVEYYVSTTAFATSPIGTEVESNYNQCTDMTIAPDIVEAVDMGASIISSLEDF
ncbi:MAG: hypothetical protein DRJ01_15280, partial [Bacteroidetes bacterium]